MADEAIGEDLGDDLEIESKPKGGLSGKKLVLFVLLPLLLLGGGGAGAYFLGFLDPLLGVEEPVAEGEGAEEPEADASTAIFYDLPEMLVNLQSNGRKASYLKISIALELVDEDSVQAVETVVPRIIDNFQVYLRGLRIEDLQGTAGLERLREELLLRVNTAAKGKHVSDVLFKEMLIQ